jgi:hypothetical protein
MIYRRQIIHMQGFEMISRHEGCIGSDRIDIGQLRVGDIFNGLPFPDELFDMIVAYHSPQMIRFDDLP